MAYVTQERKESHRWESLTQTMDKDEAEVHLSRIGKKRADMDRCEAIAKRFAAEAGLVREPAAWPKLSDRFSSLGDEVGYRVLYAAMCSQTHNDAEDLFNFLAIATSSVPLELIGACEQRIAREALFFARFLLYRGVEYLFKALSGFAKLCQVDELLALADGYQKEISRLAFELAAADHRDATQFGEELERPNTRDNGL